VGHTEIDGLSRITVVVDVDELPHEQVTKQLNKLNKVIKIVELDPAQSVLREHLLIKVRVDNTTRSQVLEAVNLFRARDVDDDRDAGEPVDLAVPDGEALDVESAAGEQPRDAGEKARFVLDEEAQNVGAHAYSSPQVGAWSLAYCT
jgi:hypothetical protein